MHKEINDNLVRKLCSVKKSIYVCLFPVCVLLTAFFNSTSVDIIITFSPYHFSLSPLLSPSLSLSLSLPFSLSLSLISLTLSLSLIHPFSYLSFAHLSFSRALCLSSSLSIILSIYHYVCICISFFPLPPNNSIPAFSLSQYLRKCRSSILTNIF